MNRYAILSQSNIVENITVADSPQDTNWEICPVEVGIGWKRESNGSWTSPSLPFNVFLKGVAVKANALPAQYFAGNYYANPGNVVEVSGNLVDSAGNVQLQISFPLTLKLPMVRHADAVPTIDEIYMNFTLVNGAFVATTEIKSSGDWKLLVHRLNGALERVFAATNAPVDRRFLINADDITIIV